MALEILVGSPVGIPAGANEDRLPSKVMIPEHGAAYRTASRQIRGDHDTRKICQTLKGKFRQILAIGVAMEGRVEVRAGVGDHLNLADLKLSARSVMRPRLLSAEEIADEWSGQSLVGYHPIFNDMTDIDQHKLLLGLDGADGD